MRLQLAVGTPALDQGARSPLSRNAFLVVLLVLIICLLAVDLMLHGPLTTAAADYVVVRPAERDWGFHAEWKNYGSASNSQWLLTVVRVTPGGAFDRAGIRPGFAFAPRLHGFHGPRFGGPYNIFSDAKSSVRVRMLANPDELGEGVPYAVTR